MFNTGEGTLKTSERDSGSRFTGCNFYLFLSSSSTFLIINIDANTQREQKCCSVDFNTKSSAENVKTDIT